MTTLLPRGRHRAPVLPRVRGWALMALVASLAGLALVTVSPRADVVAADGSEVTKSGTGRFTGLSVTVSQTERLLNQAVTVSWSGGKPTQPVSGGFGTHYLQVMQCWGDDAAGPKREQCQWGSRTDSRGGGWSGSRQTSYGSTLVEPADLLRLDPRRPPRDLRARGGQLRQHLRALRVGDGQGREGQRR